MSTEPDPAGTWYRNLPAKTREWLRPYRRGIIILSLHLLLFFAARVALWLIYRDDFRSLGMGELAEAFLRGTWFDASVIFRVIGLPLFLLLLPFRWAGNRIWQGIWIWICFAAWMLFAILIVADLAYYGFVHRHLGLELSYLTWVEIRTLLTESRPEMAVLFFAVMGGCGFLWRKLLKNDPGTPSRKWIHFAICLLILAGMGTVARGGLFLRKSLHVIDAYSGVSLPSGRLTVSGPFSIISTYGTIFKRDLYIGHTDFFPWEDALSRTKRGLFRETEVEVDSEYPLLRREPVEAGERPNIVILLLENWDAHYVDANRKIEGLPPLGATPNFDALSREGVFFSRFHATGQRSLAGLFSVNSGHATLPGMPYLGAGLEELNMPYLPLLAREEGYNTIFLQGTGRYFQRLQSAASRVGFETVLSGEEIPADLDSRPRGESTAWDHELLEEAHKRFSRTEEPFLGMVFTSSTHDPFNFPVKPPPRFSVETMEGKYLNSLHYADEAIGEFFLRARKEEYYSRTIFVLISDHASGLHFQEENPVTLFQIPCLILGPGIPPRVEDQIGSQADLLPTLVSLANWNTPHAAIGKSLLQKGERGAICVWGRSVIRVEDSKTFFWQGTRDAGKKVSRKEESIQTRLLALLQVVYHLYRGNRISPRAK